MDMRRADDAKTLVQTLVDRVLDRLERARERRHALSLDDRMLRDIGASRGTIERLVDRG